MALLFNADYAYLEDANLQISEVENSRFVIFENFPLPKGIYKSSSGEQISAARILVILPPNYNASGPDMFWTYPELRRLDGGIIPAVGGGDSREHEGITFERWSRHWHQAGWQPKNHGIETIVDRISWALCNPEAKRT